MRVVHQRFEVIAGEGHLRRRITQPFYILLNFVDEKLVLHIRVGVVVTQVATAFEMKRGLEINSDGFEVANMQMTIRFRRKSEPLLSFCDTSMHFIYLFGIAFYF